MKALNKENFDENVSQASGVVLVDYWSESCDRCKELLPEVEALAEKYGDRISFCKLDIKGARRVAMAQGVMGLPSLVFYRDGQKQEHLTGEELEVAQIEETIQGYL